MACCALDLKSHASSLQTVLPLPALGPTVPSPQDHPVEGGCSAPGEEMRHPESGVPWSERLLRLASGTPRCLCPFPTLILSVFYHCQPLPAQICTEGGEQWTEGCGE